MTERISTEKLSEGQPTGQPTGQSVRPVIPPAPPRPASPAGVDYLTAAYLAKVDAIRIKVEEAIAGAMAELNLGLMEAGLWVQTAMERRNKEFQFGRTEATGEVKPDEPV